MLNDYYVNYNKKDKVINNTIETEIFTTKANARSIAPRSGIPEFDKNIKDPEAMSQASKVSMFNDYPNETKEYKKESMSNLFSFYFKDLEPDKINEPLSNYYRYNVKNLGSASDIALDRADMQYAEENGEPNNTTK